MVGNDVIDLSDRDADAATFDPRFDGRVFCDEELESFDGADSPDRQRWRLWAAKEAGYKLARRLRPMTVFSPRRFVVSLGELIDERRRGFVLHDDAVFQIEVREAAHWVHAVAIPLADRFGDLVVSVKRIAHRADDPALNPNVLSRTVRRLATTRIAAHLGVARDALRIGRVERIPDLRLDGHKLPHGLSLSHHGAMVAFACSEAADPR